MVMPVVTSIDGTTLLKYSLKPVLRIVIYNYETCWISQWTSGSIICHFWITIGGWRAWTPVRWPAIPIDIFLDFPKILHSGMVFNLGKEHFLQYDSKSLFTYYLSCNGVWSRLLTGIFFKKGYSYTYNFIFSGTWIVNYWLWNVLTGLILYAPCIILQYEYKPTKCTKFLWLRFIYY